MKNRLLSMILAISMVLTFLPVSAISAFADVGSTSSDDLKWSIDDNGTLTISGYGAMKDYDNYANRSPWHNFNFTNVVIEDGVTSIGEWAFYECKLTQITIPNSVTSIGKNAFDSSGLTSVTIPSSVTSVGEYAFVRCSSLSSLTIENSVISRYEFYGCTSLTEVTIPGAVSTIEVCAFKECSNLGTVTIENGVTAIGNEAFMCTLTKDKNGNYVGASAPFSVTIPDSVTSIGSCAFYGRAGLTNIALPSGLKTIPVLAFSYTGLTEIDIPNSVTTIEREAFLKCTSLTRVSVPSSVKTIGEGAFSGCTSLSIVNIPAGVQTIETYTFRNCAALDSIEIPGSVEKIGMSAFEGTGLVHLDIPEGVTTLVDGAFKNCHSLLDVKIPKTVSDMDPQFGSIFMNCEQLNTVTFAKDGKLTVLGTSTFEGCKALKTITFPDSLHEVRRRGFKGCEALETLTLPNNFSGIEESAFQDCIGLKNITITLQGSTYLNIGTDAFKGCTNLEKIYYTGSLAKLRLFNSDWVRIIGLTGLDTGDTQIVYEGQAPIDLVYRLSVRFYTPDYYGRYECNSANDTSVYHNETLASDKVPTLESKDGYTLHWRVDSADGEEFVLGETPVTKGLYLYAVYTLDTKGVTVPAGVTVKDADGNTITPDENGKVSVTPGQKITLEAPTKTDNGDAYEWTISGNGSEQPETKISDSITVTVNDETEIKLETLKALHITNEGKPNTTGTKYDETSGTYYGNGWEYSETAGLTIKANADLSNEPAVTVNVTVETGKTVSNAKLTGDVTNNGTLSNCVLDKAPTGGTVENSLFGAEYTGAHTLTEADGKDITAKLDGVKDGSLTGKTLWFVGTPKLTATVENTEIKHINHDDVKASKITGVKGTVETDNADNSVTFTPNGEKNILLNNRTAESGDFTFTTPEDCTYDGNVHKVDDITSTTYMDGEYTVKYDYKKPDGTPGDETEEPKNAGTYTVKIVMSDGQTIDTGKSFTIKPAEPGKDDFEFVKDLPSGVTEDRDDSEKTAEVQLKSDSLFQKNGAGVEQEYQKKNADGEWEKVTAPSGKGEYKLVATVTTTDPNLTGGTVEWEFTILDREDANWLTMSVEDGKITKVTRPAADDAEAEEDITEKVLLTASADGSKTAYKVPAGAQVTVTANDAPQDMKFEMWRFSVNSMNGDTALALYSRSMTFTLKDDVAGLTVSAMYQDAAIDSGYDILGPAAAATTAVVGSAILAYPGHMLGTELYLIYLLPSGAVIPANRIQLAMLLWQDAGNPAPVDETLYTDIDANDTDAMQAAQWAVETGLMELPDADNAPDQFDPYAAVSNVDVIHAWKKAQKVKG